MSFGVSPSRNHKKKKWSPKEDEQLRAAVQAYGIESWGRISTRVPRRSGKQCRERWIGQLAPSVSKHTWTPEEDAILLRNHAVIGNRWTMIAAQLPGRSALQVKNRWNWLRRRQMCTEQCVLCPQMAVRLKPAVDVVELRPPRRILEPISIDDSLFGAAFQEFQAKMFLH
jgi:myb proto-oncogene protein